MQFRKKVEKIKKKLSSYCLGLMFSELAKYGGQIFINLKREKIKSWLLDLVFFIYLIMCCTIIVIVCLYLLSKNFGIYCLPVYMNLIIQKFYLNSYVLEILPKVFILLIFLNFIMFYNMVNNIYWLYYNQFKKIDEWVRSKFIFWSSFLFMMCVFVYMIYIFTIIMIPIFIILLKLILYFISNLLIIISDIFFEFLYLGFFNLEISELDNGGNLDIYVNYINNVDSRGGIIRGYYNRHKVFNEWYANWEFFSKLGFINHKLQELLLTEKMQHFENINNFLENDIKNAASAQHFSRHEFLNDYYETVKNVNSIDELMSNNIYTKLQNLKLGDEIIITESKVAFNYLTNYGYGKGINGEKWDPFFDRFIEMYQKILERNYEIGDVETDAKLENYLELSLTGNTDLYTLKEYLDYRIIKSIWIDGCTGFEIKTPEFNKHATRLTDSTVQLAQMVHKYDESKIKEFIDTRLLLLQEMREVCLDQIINPSIINTEYTNEQIARIRRLLKFQEQLFNITNNGLIETDAVFDGLDSHLERYVDRFAFRNDNGEYFRNLDEFSNWYIREYKGTAASQNYIKLLKQVTPGELRYIANPGGPMTGHALSRYIEENTNLDESIIAWNVRGNFVGNIESLLNEVNLHTHRYNMSNADFVIRNCFIEDPVYITYSGSSEDSESSDMDFRYLPNYRDYTGCIYFDTNVMPSELEAIIPVNNNLLGDIYLTEDMNKSLMKFHERVQKQNKYYVSFEKYKFTLWITLLSLKQSIYAEMPIAETRTLNPVFWVLAKILYSADLFDLNNLPIFLYYSSSGLLYILNTMGMCMNEASSIVMDWGALCSNIKNEISWWVTYFSCDPVIPIEEVKDYPWASPLVKYDLVVYYDIFLRVLGSALLILFFFWLIKMFYDERHY